MEPFSQLYRQSALVKLATGRLTKALRIVCLAAVAAASLAAGAEIVLVADATPAAAQYVSAEQKMATIQFFDTYDAAARRELEKVASHPNKPEARNQRLEGKVGVALEVNGSGDLQQAEVIRSSQSKILDSAALASVRWAKYPAFASGSPTGELSRRYTVIFDYRLPVEK